jgi:hypothetical protein
MGSPYNIDDVRRAIRGCDAVLSTLNNPRKSDFPWAKQIGPRDVLERSVKNALTVMKENGIKRIITQSTIGASESMKIAPAFMRFLVKYSNLNIVFADHTNAEAVLKNSSSDWTSTSVRATGLSDREDEKNISVDYTTKPAMFIGRKNVAKFMVDIIDNPDYFKKAPIISEK